MARRTPSDFTGDSIATGLTGNERVRVTKSDESPEFATVQQIADLAPIPPTPAFTDLTDVPHSYAGHAQQPIRVNATEDGLEFFVIAPGGPIDASDVNNDSGVPGTTVADALDNLDAADTANLSTAESYADTGDAATLASANSHSDTNDALQLHASQLDTDGALAANSDARVASQKATKTYVDAAKASAISTAESYADTGDAATLASANSHSDTNDALQLHASQLDTDGALAANSDARVASQKATKTYVDAAKASAISTAESYADTGDAATLASANSHSDTNDALQLHASQLDTDGALAANSDARVASQKATKTYVDAQTYTDEKAEDAVGGILTDTATIDFTYDDAGNQIRADVKVNSIDKSLMHASAASVLFGRTTAGAGAGEEVPLDVDGTLAANSDIKVASQKAVKTYTDAAKASAISTAESYADTGDAATLVSANSHSDTNDALQLHASQLDTDGALAANSDAKVASQKATKTYVDALLNAQDAMVFKGVIDCSANPNYPAANAGYVYKVSVAGKIGGASGVNVEVGDTLYCITDSSASGTQAGVGANWVIVQTNIDGAVIGPASATSGDFATFNGTSGKLIQDSGIALDTDTGLAANSDSKISSQKAVKAYVDAQTYTDEKAEDAVGGILTDTATVDFTYDDAGNQIRADVKANSIDKTLMHASAASVLFGRTTAGAGAGEEVSLDVDGTFVANSDINVASQKAVKTYVDTAKASAISTSEAYTDVTTRPKLLADRTYYVRTDGSNSNNGLTNTSGGAFLTFQYALDLVYGTLDLNNYNVTVQVADGSYTENVDIPSPQVGKGTITIQGNNSTPTNVALTSLANGTCFATHNAAILVVKDMTLAGGSGTTFLFRPNSNSQIQFGNVVLGACTQALRPEQGAILKAIGNFTVSGSMNSLFLAISTGTLSILNVVVTFSGSPTISTLISGVGGYLELYGTTYSGTVTTTNRMSLTESFLDLRGLRSTLPGTSVIDIVINSLIIIGSGGGAPYARNAIFARTINFTFIVTDAERITAANKATTAITCTIPPNSSVAFEVGTLLEVWQQNTGQVQWVAGVGVTINSSTGTLTSRAQYGRTWALKTDTDTWWLTGDLTNGHDLAGNLLANLTGATDQRLTTLIRDTYQNLSDAGLLTKLKGLWVHCVPTQADALINWITPGTRNMTILGSPTFAANVGFTGDGATAQLSTVSNLLTFGAAQDDHSFGCYVSTASASAAAVIGDTPVAGGRRYRLQSASSGALAVNDQSGTADSYTPSPANYTGLFTVVRSVSTGYSIYRNEIKAVSITRTSSATTVIVAFLGTADTTGSEFSTATIAFSFVGSSLTDADVALLYEIMYPFVTDRAGATSSIVTTQSSQAVNLAPTQNVSLPASYSLIAVRKYTIAANCKISLGSDAILKVL